MENTLHDLELHEAFGIILSKEYLRDYIADIAELILNKDLNKKTLKTVLDNYQIDKIENIKEELLYLLILYINLILEDHIITEKEKRNISLLKILFKIKEGDFFKYSYKEIENIIDRQIKRLYVDNKISKEEAIYRFEIQDIFDLSYDQLDKMKEKEIQRALEEGAKITDLDTAKYPKGYKDNLFNI